ncbi:hypothetical protein J4E91_000501 [Alternaria rosae]|nr:hypothetical protein J4E91_000501 [Alternaria rosae]
MRGRLYTNTIAGFYQPEHALAAVKHLSGNPEVDTHVMYTVYFTAPKELSDAVLVDVEDIMSQVPEASAAWEKPRQGMVTLRISGTDQEKVVDMKRILEAIFSGRVATAGLGGHAARYEIWHNFFATASGAKWLQYLAREKGVIIMSDKFQQRLCIYDPEQDDARMRLVERDLAEKAIMLSTWEETTTIQFTSKDFRELLKSDKIARAQNKLEPHIGWTCAKYESHLLRNEHNEQLLDEYKAAAGTKECPKCATLIEKVDGCNHVECSGCHGHMCWVCLKVFPQSEAAYQHMNDAHGGNGLVEGEDDEDGDSDSDEEESGDDDDDEREDANDFADLI